MNALNKAVPVIVNGHDTGITANHHEITHVGIDPINGYINVNIQSYLTQQAREAGMGPVTMFSRQITAAQLDTKTVIFPAADKGVVGVIADYLIASDEALKDAQVVQTA